MIKSFKDKNTAALFLGLPVRAVPASLRKGAKAKLDLLHVAGTLEDLRIPPGNQLESLRGDRKGQHSIRINRQWRICFTWHTGAAWDVEIVDYH